MGCNDTMRVHSDKPWKEGRNMNMKGVDLGVFYTTEHMPLDALISEAYIEKFMKQDMAMMPTMMAYADRFQEEEVLHYIETVGRKDLVPEAFAQRRDVLKKCLSEGRKKPDREGQKSAFYDRRQYIMDMHPNQVKNLQQLHRMGATVGAGTDLGGVYTGIFGRYTREIRWLMPGSQTSMPSAWLHRIMQRYSA